MSKQTQKKPPQSRPLKAPSKPSSGKPRSKPQGKSAPLPPPVPVEAAAPPSSDPFNLEAEFQSGAASADFSASSSTSTEPRPGEPLTAEAEAQLADLPAIGGEADDPGGPADVPGADPALIKPIAFNEAKVRKYLVETFDWLADRFDSEHWCLTDNQAEMLAGPTAELLGGVWTKISVILPDALANFPGATAFLVAFSFVVVPKAAQQMAISRARKSGKKVAEMPRRPVGVPHRGPAPPPEPPPAPGSASGDADFHVTGD